MNWRRLSPGVYTTDGDRVRVQRMADGRWKWKAWYLRGWSAVSYDTMTEARRAAETNSQGNEPEEE